MEAAQKETEFLKVQLQELDDGLLESMLTLEDSESTLHRLEAALQEDETEWVKRQAELAGEREVLLERVVDLEARRKAMTAQVSQRQLQLYESLRTSKGRPGCRQSRARTLSRMPYGSAYPPAAKGTGRSRARSVWQLRQNTLRQLTLCATGDVPRLTPNFSVCYSSGGSGRPGDRCPDFFGGEESPGSTGQGAG